MVPASLVSLVVGTILEHTLFREGFSTRTRTVGDTTPMNGNFPEWHFPNNFPSESKTWGTIVQMAVTLAAIGSVESVLTLQAVNEITDTVTEVRHNNQELFAQGLANLLCGLFSAMGGDAMIGQSTINVSNGARHRVSSVFSGIFILLFVVLLSKPIELLPIATLTGVLFMVVLSTFQWSTFGILLRGRKSDSLVILIVTIVAVLTNLAIAIIAGVACSALTQAWDAGNLVTGVVTYSTMQVNGEQTKVKHCRIQGSLFFGSTRKFIAMFSVSQDPSVVVIDFEEALIADHSAVAAIRGITHRFAQVGKKVLLTNVNAKSRGRLDRTGDKEQLKHQLCRKSELEFAHFETEEMADDFLDGKRIPNQNSERGGEGQEGVGASEVLFKVENVTVDVGEVGVRNADPPKDFSPAPPSSSSSLPMFTVPTKSVDTELNELEASQNNVVEVDAKK